MHMHVFIHMHTHIIQLRSRSSDMSLKAAHSLNWLYEDTMVIALQSVLFSQDTSPTQLTIYNLYLYSDPQSLQRWLVYSATDTISIALSAIDIASQCYTDTGTNSQKSSLQRFSPTQLTIYNLYTYSDPQFLQRSHLCSAKEQFLQRSAL